MRIIGDISIFSNRRVKATDANVRLALHNRSYVVCFNKDMIKLESHQDVANLGPVTSFRLTSRGIKALSNQKPALT